jgi:hypothetical protein
MITFSINSSKFLVALATVQRSSAAIQFHSSRTSILRFETFTGTKQFKKTPSPAPTLEATNKVISLPRFQKPETPLFPGPLNFFCADDSAIGGSVRVVMWKVVEGHAKAPILDDHCIADKSRYGHCVFSETRLYKATQLEVAEILTMKLEFDYFSHPANAPKNDSICICGGHCLNGFH